MLVHQHQDPFSLSNQLHIERSIFKAGSLRAKINIWKRLTSDPEILDTLTRVSLSFQEPPFQDRLSHEIKFSGDEEKLVAQELQKFLDQGIIEFSELRQGDYVFNLFARPKKSPVEIRLILNLK